MRLLHRRVLLWVLGLLGLAGLVTGLAAAWWLHAPIEIRPAAGAQVLDLEIEFGDSPRSVAQTVRSVGAQVNPTLLYAWFRVSGQARQIKAGNYEIAPGTAPRALLRMLVRGEETLKTVILPEGLNFAQVRAALAKAEMLRPDSSELTPEQIMDKIGRPGLHPEGRFFPDTYSYGKGSSDLQVLRRAARAMDKRLEQVWSQREPGLPIDSAQQALILASIVEKETGKASDRPLIAGVFVNRLRIGMRLQTDPTVIYGLGERFDGDLRKRDLLADTPYNTYTRSGLPPTPIAMPGKAALLAAVQPARTPALYFVARGDGSSQFSATLEEHNRPWRVGRWCCVIVTPTPLLPTRAMGVISTSRCSANSSAGCRARQIGVGWSSRSARSGLTCRRPWRPSVWPAPACPTSSRLSPSLFSSVWRPVMRRAGKPIPNDSCASMPSRASMQCGSMFTPPCNSGACCHEAG